MAEVFFWKEAERDYKKLDGALKQWVNTAEDRLKKEVLKLVKTSGTRHIQS